MSRTARPTPPGLRPTLPTWAVLTSERLAHVQRVAELAASWAEAMGVPDSERHRWLRAVWLHDALRDAAAEELERWAPSTPGPVELKHGPAAAARAKSDGEVDRGVLDAVRYHSVGLAEWDMVGRILYAADFLEPGREFDRADRVELARRFPDESRGVLREVARRRVAHTVASGWPLLEPTFRFWNSLVASSSPR
ncbi:MAG TPA: HD domain-containing protein [Gemmatimonadales bacterium]|jgi:HD superfamily phosphohydrolase YqeK|nr:HD domain-containing protein [Gemmatimonadales bacterium]